LIGDKITSVKEAYFSRETKYNGFESNVITGGTVAWNQLIRITENVYVVGNASNVANVEEQTVTSTATASTTYYFGFYKSVSSLQTGHRILVTASITNESFADESILATTPYRVSFGTNSAPSTQELYLYNKTYAMFTVANVGSRVGIRALATPKSARFTEGDTFTAKFNVFDLTQMFGSTIADYIYSLEQANEGAGVAWFKKLFPKDYYEYDAGTLKSVEGLISHDTVGFNQWDEEWEVGTINSTNGENISNYLTIRSKNYQKCLPSTTYGCTKVGAVFWYDANKEYISASVPSNGVVTSKENARYFRLRSGTSYGDTYNHDICINLNLSHSGYRDGTYEPYQKHSYALDSSLVLRGIPKLDAQNNLYFDGDVYNHDGTVERRYGIVDLGSLTWTYNTSPVDFFSAQIQGIKSATDNTICMYANSFIHNSISNVADKQTMLVNQQFRIRDSKYTDAESFKTVMSGVMLVYELATPTTEQAEPFQEVQICDDFGTEEFVTTSIVPVGHVTKYYDNLRQKLEDLPAIPSVPSDNGTYTLKVTVTDGVPTLSWVQ